MKLAERGSLVGAREGMWMREVRKLTSGGHQTSLISTAFDRDGLQDALVLRPEADVAKVADWEQRKSTLREEIEQLEHQVALFQTQLKSTPKHIEWDQFPEDAKFKRLAPSRGSKCGKRAASSTKLGAFPNSAARGATSADGPPTTR